MPVDNKYGTIWDENYYSQGLDYEYVDKYTPQQFKEKYDQPDIYSLMGDYVYGTDQQHTGATEGTQNLLETMKQMIPAYKETPEYFQEHGQRAKMLSSISGANIKQSSALRQAKAKAGGEMANYGKMGFKGGESGQMAQYINKSLQNSSNSNAAAAQKARLGFKVSVDASRKDFVDSLWDLYGDFVALKPERVG